MKDIKNNIMKEKLHVWLISLMTIRPLMSWSIQIELILNKNKSTLFLAL